ncbi:MAG TPA: Cys-tRNA(Pro) deacylase [Gammaproteobacteria bacterium]|jgi:Cys-tRNA(Pro)/Cys-tRNA(Cys) deacylase|nr:Cys-tRNA(Pro) deacylase [Gammaproteobacteria bacterium]
MTPCIALVQQRKVAHRVHEYIHDPTHASYGLEAAEKLGIPPERVFKTLVVSLDARELAVGLVPVSSSLNVKQMARALGAKRAAMAEKSAVERSTGYVLGGVSPLGQKRQLRTCIDSSAAQFATILVSAGRRGLEIELAPDDLVSLLGGRYASLCR